MSQHHTVPAWVRGQYQEGQSYWHGAPFKPLRSLSKGVTSELEVVRLTAPPCDSFVHRRIFIHSWQAEERRNIAEEIRKLKCLDHRHIFAITGTHQTAHEYGILMHPIDYQDLEAFLTELGNAGDRQLHEHKTWLHGWFSCLASALCYMHDRGLHHGNIAPRNIIHRGPEVYFTDFGLANCALEQGQATPTPLAARTISPYGPPEADRNKRKPNRRSDIFSLGCVYLEMLTALDNRSVKDFRTRCQQSMGFNDPTEPFRYHLALHEIKACLGRNPHSQNLCDGWGRLILHMLDLNRRDRPYAGKVLRQLQTEDLLLPRPERFCACHSSFRADSQEAMDLTESLDLTEYMDLTEALEPTENLEPAKSLELAETLELTEAVEPTEALLEPAEALERAEALEPVEALKPIEALEPAEYLGPAESLEPAETLELTKTLGPAEALEPTEAHDHVESQDLIETRGLNETENLMETHDHTQTEDLMEPQGSNNTKYLMETQDSIDTENLTENQDSIDTEDLTETQNFINTENLVETQDFIDTEDLMGTQNFVDTDDMETQDFVDTEDHMETHDFVDTEDLMETQDSIDTEDLMEVQDSINPQDLFKSKNLDESMELAEAKTPTEAMDLNEAMNLTEAKVIAEAQDLIDAQGVSEALELSEAGELTGIQDSSEAQCISEVQRPNETQKLVKNHDLSKATQLSGQLPAHTAELEEMEVEELFFEVHNDTTVDFRIRHITPVKCQPWHKLEVLPSFDFRGLTFRVGDLVQVETTSAPESPAEIVEVRAVGDGTDRILIRVFWYYQRKHLLPKIRRAHQKKFLASRRYIKSTHTQVILWDTIQRRVTTAEKALVLQRKVVDMAWTPYRIFHSSAPEVSWTNVIPGGPQPQPPTPE